MKGGDRLLFRVDRGVRREALRLIPRLKRLMLGYVYAAVFFVFNQGWFSYQSFVVVSRRRVIDTSYRSHRWFVDSLSTLFSAGSVARCMFQFDKDE